MEELISSAVAAETSGAAGAKELVLDGIDDGQVRIPYSTSVCGAGAEQ